MADFPTYARFTVDGFGELMNPNIRQTEMEKGPKKMQIVSSKVMAEMTGTVVFRSAKEAADFESWYLNTIKRIGWFNMKHPRTGQTILGRLKDANIGTLTRVSPRWNASYREITVEYQR